MANSLLSLAAWSARVLPMPLKQFFYKFPPLARFLRRSLNKAVPEGLTVVKVAGGDLRGFSLKLDLREEKDYWLGTYEPELQKAIRDFIKPGTIVYDVGANIGYISLLFARQVGDRGKVWSFEALPSNVERLRSNVLRNGFQDRVEIIAAAVIDQSKPVLFLVGPSDGMGKAEGSAGRQEFAYPTSIEVAGISLDDFCFRSGNPLPNAIKIDIEGGEVLALPGMRHVLEVARPLILIELHGEKSAQAAWENIDPLDYRLCKMKKSYPPIHSLEALGWKSYLVAIPNEQ
jgi:FkbM family methyltransferase